MNTAAMCICPDGRNHVDCEKHRCLEIRHTLDTPIWIELAWEMDLNWASSADALFRQWDQLPLWKFDRHPLSRESSGA